MALIPDETNEGLLDHVLVPVANETDADKQHKRSRHSPLRT